MMASVLPTTYSDGRGVRRVAIQLPWDQVAAVLGHPHRGTPDDDAALLAWLHQHGAPAWIDTAEGWIDDTGWDLIGPPLSSEAFAPSAP